MKVFYLFFLNLGREKHNETQPPARRISVLVDRSAPMNHSQPTNHFMNGGVQSSGFPYVTVCADLIDHSTEFKASGLTQQIYSSDLTTWFALK